MVILFSYTKGAYEFSVEFCVVKFSSFGWSFDGLRNKEGQEPKLGDAQWRKYALEAIIKLLFISLYHDKCLLFMLELY